MKRAARLDETMKYVLILRADVAKAERDLSDAQSRRGSLSSERVQVPVLPADPAHRRPGTPELVSADQI